MLFTMIRKKLAYDTDYVRTIRPSVNPTIQKTFHYKRKGTLVFSFFHSFAVRHEVYLD